MHIFNLKYDNFHAMFSQTVTVKCGLAIDYFDHQSNHISHSQRVDSVSISTCWKIVHTFRKFPAQTRWLSFVTYVHFLEIFVSIIQTFVFEVIHGLCCLNKRNNNGYMKNKTYIIRMSQQWIRNIIINIMKTYFISSDLIVSYFFPFTLFTLYRKISSHFPPISFFQ